MIESGADPGFQVREAHLKKLGGISCEISRFYAKKKKKKSNFRGGARLLKHV